jgi:UDP-2-acetamido-3-amino-2,3-dideoxy-glucuronate N-acetyltransferase
MVFTNVINSRFAVDRKNENINTPMGKGASIEANATIVFCHNVGKFSFIGAGAVVTTEVYDYASCES